MTHCSGAPAQQHALAYIEGTLAEFEAERFEEHYFDCSACLAHLQALQAVGQELVRHPAVLLDQVRTRQPLAWPARAGALAAAAVLVVAGGFAIRVIGVHTAQPSQAHSLPAAPLLPAQAPQPPHPPLVQPSQLADLALPVFVPRNLRGESEDPRFQAGMRAYGNGDCRGAVVTLSQVPDSSPEARAARFYSAACQMHLDQFSAAASGLRAVAQAPDSPQRELALYYLAQIALAGDDPSAAHRYLLHTIVLRGDMEHAARLQDRKVVALIEQRRETGNPWIGNKKP